MKEFLGVDVPSDSRRRAAGRPLVERRDRILPHVRARQRDLAPDLGEGARGDPRPRRADGGGRAAPAVGLAARQPLRARPQADPEGDARTADRLGCASTRSPTSPTWATRWRRCRREGSRARSSGSWTRSRSVCSPSYLPAPSSSTRTRTSATTSTGCADGPTSCFGCFDRFGITGSFTFCLDEPDRVPAFRAANDRTLAYAADASGSDPPLRPARPRREPARGGQPLSRPRRTRDQAASARAEVLGRRRAPRPGLRPRGRARRADPDPRRPRPAADRRPSRRARRPLHKRPADHRPRRNRRPRRSRRPLRACSRRLLRHLGVEHRRPPRPDAPGGAAADPVRNRLSVRPPAERAPARTPLAPGSRSSTSSRPAACSAPPRSRSQTATRCPH